jgi:hypothetical protein
MMREARASRATSCQSNAECGFVKAIPPKGEWEFVGIFQYSLD